MTKEQRPLVSIIMATYNRAQFIVETLISIQNQTFENWECLIIDDGGTDNTVEVISPILKTDSRFSYQKRTKSYIYHRFPDLKNIPIAETRVCQYENSLDGNFIMNYHKKNNKVLVLSGSSGHGFKLGPGLGEIVKNILLHYEKIPIEFDLKRLKNNSTSSQYYNAQLKYNEKKRLFN